MITKHQELTAADKKTIGFDYQFLYFIYNLIALEPGQVLGYEVKDDVHLELPNGENIYMQLKHSLTAKESGEIDSLTQKDSDLWKTFYNWVVVIGEVSANKEEQLEFINKTRFILVTNKTKGENAFVEQIEQLNIKKINIEEFKKYVQALKETCKGTKEGSIKLRKYMQELLNLENTLLEKFIMQVDFKFEFDEMPQKLKNRVLGKNIDVRKVDSALNEIIGTFELWKFNKVKNKDKLLIRFEDVDKKLRAILNKARSTDLPRIRSITKLPDKLNEQEFIKELLEIEDIGDGDEDLMLEFTTCKIEIFNLLSKWIEEGYITESDWKELDEQAIFMWKNKHRKVHKKSKNATTNEELIRAAQQCIDELREQELKINHDELKYNESNGLFYYLSDNEKIGWQYKWKEKYI
ncbi:hypothetical protein QTL86_04385 [Cellulosilyticum sp. ST5]|uniref:hypothetical protein n=1 Tax=Cellulosilyticum sp. ST5 TaxID=3055805 RepID=UPI003977A7DF